MPDPTRPTRPAAVADRALRVLGSLYTFRVGGRETGGA